MIDDRPYQRMVGGDWIDYIHDVCTVIYEHRPASMLELGCGALHAAKAYLSYPVLERYVGVDREPKMSIQDHAPYVWPHLSVRLIKSDIHSFDLGLLGDQGFECALIDAHAGDEKQHGLDHLRQIEIVDQLRIPLVLVDDCRINSVMLAHLSRWGEPTGKGKGVTGLWWWKR